MTKPASSSSSLPDSAAAAGSLHLFCRVVDNYGDIGVCWRLARQIAQEHGRPVLLWVDDLLSFARICAALDLPLLLAGGGQVLDGVMLRHWTEAAFARVAPQEVGAIVVEGFGCRLPETYVAAMAQCQPPPCWINLEYLSAESWVEGCHAMVSPHPALPLNKYFFFPGFSAGTGGLPVERGLPQQRDAFQADAMAQQAFLAGLGVVRAEAVLMVSLFCYPSAPVSDLFDVWRKGNVPVLCLVPEGVASAAVADFLQGAGIESKAASATATQGALRVQVLPFVDQPDYDRLLWCCDLNFVRGEDSFVRAQWAAKPFVWHIYPQDEAAHLLKLEAFLTRYTAALPPATGNTVAAYWRAWNGTMPGNAVLWRDLQTVLPQSQVHAAQWALQLLRNGDLASNLLEFAAKCG
ncbi:elongation factor P maturation arginine rhamnosyltransferase EarP [Herbaspirillum sp. RTI4]|uniref:elongation factor P maturation arginine rhamnosyltransferase EarP n=1 Tax=Herbaspirillum sp. RTI4 TaxID=3048640 RepID=UPI002AB5447B|nr:elongation factor P maturation arginine rhamnosyltransferase EarP [Herbaspirillum sp. RTI4]MDY7579503.1 elongation factor P maturation arginine rhamnosyltransferase EarP [Herbaspirillum sp. RTI4]MEA9980417.1 elongation factor P maturation arginine rhamnosyltransferase EarP [Herbaspirillum sp. RTI4]